MRQSLKEVRTVQQAVQAGTPSLARIRRDLGEEKLHAYLRLHLVYLNQLLGLKRPLNETQIDAIADEIINTHRVLTVADIHLISKRAMTGHYGEFYESISMPKVLSWFTSYFEERCQGGATRSLDAHSQLKEYNDTGRKTADDEVRASFDVARSHYLINKKKNE